MKKVILILFAMLFISCSSDDVISIDMSKVYGKWYGRNLCPEQNNIQFLEDNTFIFIKSNNVDCAINEFDTYEHSGTFNIIGDLIEFNITSSIMIIDGDVFSIFDETYIDIISRKIISLTDSTMIIETKYRFEDAPELSIETDRLDLIKE